MMWSACFVAAMGVSAIAGISDEAGHVGSRVVGDHVLIDLEPRAAIQKPARVSKPVGAQRLVVKFRDAVGARARGGMAVGSRGGDLGLGGVRAQHPFGLRQLIQLPDERIDLVEIAGARRTGVLPIDLRSMMVVEAPADRLEVIANELLALDSVEWVDFEPVEPIAPPCVDIAPFTQSFVSSQSYRGSDPGINMDAAWALGDAKGAGVKIADIEYYFHPNHEDLCGVIEEAGVTIPDFVIDNGWDNHGTAVIGILNGLENTYGVTGLVPDAQMYFFPEFDAFTGGRRATAITNASATFDAGDILVLEMQTFGVGGGSNPFVPAEFSFSVWTATRAATDAGRIVIAAAGNGNQNLDSPDYASYMNRGDSGAIIVGAGTASTSHNKLSFSTFGSRVNVQGWGQSVATTGYGGLFVGGGDQNQRYTSSFSGTSSATPIVAGAAGSLQSYAIAQYGQRLSPMQMRQVLMDTGRPQGSGGQIGPLPDVVAARSAVADLLGVEPDEPILLSPAAGSSVSLPVELAWMTGSFTTSATVTVDDDADFSSPVWNAVSASSSVTLTDATLDASTTYFWRVTADGPGGSTTSLVRSFVTAAGDSDSCGTDVNGDGTTDIEDLLQVLREFGVSAGGDTNEDGVTDIEDLLAVLREFGSDCR